MSTVIIVATTTIDKGRPIIEARIKRPDGNWSPYYKFNFDTGASYPTDIPLDEVADMSKSDKPYKSNPWGKVSSSSDRKTFPSTKVQVKGFTEEFTIDVMRQDDDHYDLFRDQPPPTRYPLLRVRDMAKYMSFIFSKENTTMTLGQSQPQELQDAVLAGKTIPRLADMKRRTDTPTSGWQWYRADLLDPNELEKSEDWFPVNTGERQAIVKRSLADKIHLSYPKLTSSNNYRADTKATILWKEAKPPLKLDNITVQVRDDNQDFARGGEPRNLIGGPAFLDKWKIVLWSSYLHMAFIPRA